MVLMCLREIGCIQELQTLLLKFIGAAFKIMKPENHKETTDIVDLKPTKRQKTDE